MAKTEAERYAMHTARRFRKDYRYTIEFWKRQYDMAAGYRLPWDIPYPYYVKMGNVHSVADAIEQAEIYLNKEQFIKFKKELRLK